MIQEGDKAPDFTSTDQDGNTISLKDFRGKKVVLYFYPKDNTPGCTAEACNIRDNFDVLTTKGFVVLGVSPDAQDSHKNFATKFRLPFTLLADPEKKIINDYGVWGQKNLYGVKFMGLKRTTFLIDEEGTVFKVFKRPKNRAHSEEILKALEDHAAAS